LCHECLDITVALDADDEIVKVREAGTVGAKRYPFEATGASLVAGQVIIVAGCPVPSTDGTRNPVTGWAVG
jgi:hypothetical protein